MDTKDNIQKVILKLLATWALLYCFLVSISLMEGAFRLFGEGFAERLFAFASNKFVGLFIGTLTTALVQSSSCTTSLVVGLVGGGVLDIGLAIPIIMGANVGTTITNTLVAHGHVTRRDEFRRATEAATVHDMFNVLTVLTLFPLELMFGFIEKSARAATDVFGGLGGATFGSPVKAAVAPASRLLGDLIKTLVPAYPALQGAVVLVLGLIILFSSLTFLVKVLKSLVLTRLERFFGTFIFRNAAVGLLVGLSITSLVQSSSVSTSLVVPMVAAGILSLEQIFPYTLGANLGTTVTAILASLATVSVGNLNGVTIAFAHLLFNIFGIVIYYPLRFVPIGLARELGRNVARNRLLLFLYVIIVFFYIPGVCIYLSEFGLTPVAIALLALLPIIITVFRLVSKFIEERRRAL
ncbi:MAG: hypothetical protein C4532_03345 [Candidatus Abyssobacteria bacterium SURF_17]|uniref:Na/Pi cotransporter family protein n=1 Tax=Candidatus Abyssobacteria bacterium SURF_17 TaxID=2093361 RepID=A0A419F6H8_9BACT|nr:MAG: hypothetical protein C4532_03345 [Candidatus Abyssubacteria bacterium SURF_17]